MFRPDPRGKREEEATPLDELRALLSGLQHEAVSACEAQPAWQDPQDVLKRLNRALDLFDIIAARLSRTTDKNTRDGIIDGIDWEGLPERFGKAVVEDYMPQARAAYEKRSKEWKKRKEE